MAHWSQRTTTLRCGGGARQTTKRCQALCKTRLVSAEGLDVQSLAWKAPWAPHRRREHPRMERPRASMRGEAPRIHAWRGPPRRRIHACGALPAWTAPRGKTSNGAAGMAGNGSREEIPSQIACAHCRGQGGKWDRVASGRRRGVPHDAGAPCPVTLRAFSPNGADERTENWKNAQNSRTETSRETQAEQMHKERAIPQPAAGRGKAKKKRNAARTHQSSPDHERALTETSAAYYARPARIPRKTPFVTARLRAA